MSERSIDRRAAELREAFDRSFAEAPAERPAPWQDLLAIRAGGDPFALRLSELSGLSAGRAVTPLPTSVSGLIGLAGLRGMLVPVYSLAALLGYPEEPAAPRWLALVGRDAPVGLAFEGLDGHLRVQAGAVTRAGGDRSTDLAPEVVRVEGGVRPLVHVQAVVEGIRQRVRQAQRKEG